MNSPQSTQNPLLPSRPNDARPHDHRSPSLCGRSDNVEVPAPKGEPTTRGHNSKVSEGGNPSSATAIAPGIQRRATFPTSVIPAEPAPCRRGTCPRCRRGMGSRLRGKDDKVGPPWIMQRSPFAGRTSFGQPSFPWEHTPVLTGACPRADGGRGWVPVSRDLCIIHGGLTSSSFPRRREPIPAPPWMPAPVFTGAGPFAGKTVIQRSLSTGKDEFRGSRLSRGSLPPCRRGACPRADGEPAPVQTGGGDGFPPSRERRVPGSRLSRGSIPSC